ncbi:hypothetical protein EDD15DRAFT_2364904 [Pisolithus albus]|nr:hypothetical protein EDD15DRAFT_2364904 [Pisolithus albus]
MSEGSNANMDDQLSSEWEREKGKKEKARRVSLRKPVLVHRRLSRPGPNAIVDVPAGADDALQRYLHVVEKWREQLVSLKELEDDIGSILHDRGILSVSSSSLPSTTNSISIGSASSKLAHVQAELQACESHLADKEREFAVRRISVIIAHVQTGENDLAADPGIAFPRTHLPSPPLSPAYQKLDPSSANAPQLPISSASDLSSLTPSQSASQRASIFIERRQDERNTHDETESSPKLAEEDIFYLRSSANGWVTDGGNAQESARGRSTRRKKSIAALKGLDGGFTDGEVDNGTGFVLWSIISCQGEEVVALQIRVIQYQ